jgi:hypothetical protein
MLASGVLTRHHISEKAASETGQPLSQLDANVLINQSGNVSYGSCVTSIAGPNGDA